MSALLDPAQTATSTARTPPSGQRAGSVRRSIRKHWQLYLLVIIPLVYFAVFKYVPMLNSVIAFKNFSVVKGIWGSPWVGLRHFERFFENPVFWTLLRNTLTLSLYALIASFPIPIILALALNEVRSRFFKRTVQLVTYAPYFISTVIVVSMVILLLSPRIGMLSNVLGFFGWQDFDLLGDPNAFRHIYVWSEIWQTAGYAAVIYMAALAGIDPALYEAARVDGAHRLQKIWHVDLPGIMPAAVVVLILSVGNVMAIGFERAFLLQNPLNLSQSEIIATYTYKVGLLNADFSQATAIGLFNSVVNLALLLGVNVAAKRVTGERVVVTTTRTAPATDARPRTRSRNRSRSRSRKVRESAVDRVIVTVVYVILSIVLMLVLVPILFIVASSFSSPEAVSSGQVGLWPVGFTLQGYQLALSNPDILRGFANSFLYTVAGTLLSLILTVALAYPLSRSDFVGRRVITAAIVFTMLFVGGLIPTYLVVQSLGMLNTPLAMIVPNAMGVWQVIIAVTFFRVSIPAELYEAAEIDGASDLRILATVVLPLSRPLIAVLALMYAIGSWNSYFDALIYLRDQDLYPLQLVLRNVLILNAGSGGDVLDQLRREQLLAELLKYSLIVVSSLPVLLLYPFVARHFTKGVMIGAVKG